MSSAMPSGDYACRFVPDAWDERDWIQVKSPRWDHLGGWVQRGRPLTARQKKELLRGRSQWPKSAYEGWCPVKMWSTVEHQ